MRIHLIPIAMTAVLFGGVASAHEAEPRQATVFRDADDGLTCAQISEEAAELSTAMGDATPQGGWLSSLGGMAKTGAAMLVPGGALAVAGVDAVRQPGRDRNEAEQAAVQNRWYYLNGLHIGRGCREAAVARAPEISTGALPARGSASPPGGR